MVLARRRHSDVVAASVRMEVAIGMPTRFLYLNWDDRKENNNMKGMKFDFDGLAKRCVL
ncbi:hypothetical protein SESBI_40982 [Sesbania bispinosa]|nr:hypothetical protein SESBI_40982 [Sesbania bispinosa]